MSIEEKATQDLAALKMYLAKAWAEIEHGFDSVEEAIEAAIVEGHDIIAADKVDSDDAVDEKGAEDTVEEKTDSSDTEVKTDTAE